jgi:nudix-type nucleoside diphosphatase (YffH/AdpP family)
MKPEIVERQRVYQGYMSVTKLRIRLVDGAVVVREVERHGDAVAVLPYDANRRTALTVRLFRAPAFDLEGEEALEEACAGMIETEAAPDTARREAMEELGVRLGDLRLIGRFWPSPGVCAERVSLFLAPYDPSDRIDAGGGLAGEHENITVLERPLAALAAEADAGALVDMKLFTLVQALRLREPELFSI